MPRRTPDEAVLKARIATQLARLAKQAPGFGTRASPRLASWPGWIDRLAGDLALLSPLDPLDALRGLRALDHRIISLELRHGGYAEEIEPTLDRQEQARAFYTDFHLALAQGDHDTLVERVVVLLTEPDLLEDHADVPQSLLDALGRDGREAVVSRLVETGDTDPSDSWKGRWISCVTHLLLADPDVDYALGEIERLGLRDRVCPKSVVRALLRHKALGGDFIAQMCKAIASVGTICVEEVEQDEDGNEVWPWRPDTAGIALCEAEGRTDLAQEIRYAAFEILLDTIQLHDWLEHLPESRRPREEAGALRQVFADSRRTRALFFLLGWPNLYGAALLLMNHHDEIGGRSCTTFNNAARMLEDIVPSAAMLLYRIAALSQFSNPNAWHDSRPRLDKCASLWAQNPGAPCISHEEFLEQLKRKTRG